MWRAFDSRHEVPQGLIEDVILTPEPVPAENKEATVEKTMKHKKHHKKEHKKTEKEEKAEETKEGEPAPAENK